jgi:hypothetical protein
LIKRLVSLVRDYLKGLIKRDYLKGLIVSLDKETRLS